VSRWPGARVLRDGRVLYWWVEIALALVFYIAYSTTRNMHQGDPGLARAHAIQLMRWQQWLGLNVEAAIHHWALGVTPVIIAANYFYGSMHFVVTITVLVVLYRRFSHEYSRWRNVLALTTALALIGFACWPLMPPRLLPPEYGFIDTLDLYPTFWSFKRGAVNAISNQFAAMPSVHCAWALWCTCAIAWHVKRWWLKALAIAYSVCTIAAIVISANHYLLDVVGGYAVLGIGAAIVWALSRLRPPRRVLS
jgi:membrane-associated phospholipid phosphatase